MEEVDEFWSNLLEELHQRSIPTYSLVSQFGFPLALRNDELVIGVMKEHFQKMLEGKADFIKTAARNITGKELFVKVKVQAQDARPEPVKAVSRPPVASGREPAAAAPSPSASGFASAATEMDDDEPSEPEPAGRGLAGIAEPFPERESRGQAKSAASGDEVAKLATATETSRYGKSAPNSPPPESGESLMVKEAYKLFEGPGSRQVG